MKRIGFLIFLGRRGFTVCSFPFYLAQTQGAVAALHMMHCFHLAGFPRGLLSAITVKASELGDFLTIQQSIVSGLLHTKSCTIHLFLLKSLIYMSLLEIDFSFRAYFSALFQLYGWRYRHFYLKTGWHDSIADGAWREGCLHCIG